MYLVFGKRINPLRWRGKEHKNREEENSHLHKLKKQNNKNTQKNRWSKTAQMICQEPQKAVVCTETNISA